MEIADKLFETALRDFESTKILYSRKQYNLALFQLQQTVEKLVKSFGIKCNVIKPEDIARKINHLPHKVFTKLYKDEIEKLSKYNRPLLIPDMVPPHQRGSTKLKESLESLKKLHTKVESAELLKIKEIPLNEIEEFIRGEKVMAKSPRINTKKIIAEIEDDFVKTNLHFMEYFQGDENVKQISEELISNSNQIAINKAETHKLNLKRQAKFQYVSYVWINLSLMTSPHEQSTRYPSITNSECPQNIYNEENVIIKNMPEFLKMLKKSIKFYKEVYNIE